MNKIQAERLTMRIVMLLTVVLLLLIEVQMARIMNRHIGAYSLTVDNHKSRILFMSIMVCLSSPLLLAWMNTKELAKKMKQLGADESFILWQQKEIYGNLAFTYLAITMCIGALSDLIH
jgi:hypothetical protein